MNALELILRLIMCMPAANLSTHVAATPAPTTTGTATIVIAACTPGETVTIDPGNYQALVRADGTVVLKVQAQDDQADPYQVQDARGTHALNGTAGAGQMLTGVCS